MEIFVYFTSAKLKMFLKPNTIELTKIEGWGDYRILVSNCEISFSFEEVGIQIGFENCELSDEYAEKIVDEIC